MAFHPSLDEVIESFNIRNDQSLTLRIISSGMLTNERTYDDVASPSRTRFSGK
jgi:hypothetical protein